ncbi:hypothetical protein WCP94_002335 [Bilophila wadsworthia]
MTRHVVSRGGMMGVSFARNRALCGMAMKRQGRFIAITKCV